MLVGGMHRLQRGTISCVCAAWVSVLEFHGRRLPKNRAAWLFSAPMPKMKTALSSPRTQRVRMHKMKSKHTHSQLACLGQRQRNSNAPDKPEFAPNSAV